jgi:hypothetical protein
MFWVKVLSALKTISLSKQGTSFLKFRSGVPSLLKSTGTARFAWVKVQEPSNLLVAAGESSSEEQAANKLAMHKMLKNRFIIYKSLMLGFQMKRFFKVASIFLKNA